MSIVIGADAAGLRLKEVVKDFLEKENFHLVDVTAEGQDFVDVTLAVAAEVNKEEQNQRKISSQFREKLVTVSLFSTETTKQKFLKKVLKYWNRKVKTFWNISKNSWSQLK